jgi:hypothetical protein
MYINLHHRPRGPEDTDQNTSQHTSTPASNCLYAPGQQYGRPSDGIDDESSSDEYDIDSDEYHEHQSSNVDELSSSRKKSRWSPEDDKRLRELRKAGQPWNWICRQFPERYPGAVQTRLAHKVAWNSLASCSLCNYRFQLHCNDE